MTTVVTPEAVPPAQPIVEDRGDVFEPEPSSPGIVLGAEFNPDILAQLAVEEQPAAVPVVEEKKEDNVIPRARFNEVNEENKQLKAQLEKFKTAPVVTDGSDTSSTQQQQTQPDPKAILKELRTQQRDALVEGDMDAYEALTEKIDDVILSVASYEAENRIKQSAAMEEVQTDMDKVAASAYEQYPFLDINSESVDMDAVNAVVIRRNELLAEGKPVAEALKIAVDEKGPKFAKLLGAGTVDTSKADEVRQMRNTQARTTAASASVAQPAALPGKGEEAFVLNVDKMDDKQFKQFSKTEAAARARGDIL